MPLTKKRSVMMLIGLYALCLVVQAVGGIITSTSVTSWYLELNRSELTPPGRVFGIAWTILYILMAVAAWRVWRVEGSLKTVAQRCWLAQLMAGLAWNMVFFGMRDVHSGFVVIASVWVLVMLTTISFWRIDRLAGALLLPLAAWLTFATYLNGYTAIAN